MWLLCARGSSSFPWGSDSDDAEEMFIGYYGGFDRFLALRSDFLSQRVSVNGDRGSRNWSEERQDSTASAAASLLSRSKINASCRCWFGVNVWWRGDTWRCCTLQTCRNHHESVTLYKLRNTVTPRGCWEMSHDVWSCLKKRRLNNDGGSFNVTWLQTRLKHSLLYKSPGAFCSGKYWIKNLTLFNVCWWDERRSKTMTDAHKTRKTCTRVKSDFPTILSKTYPTIFVPSA